MNNIVNSIKSWVYLNIGISRKAQMCLVHERLGVSSASFNYDVTADDILSELKKGKPNDSGYFILFNLVKDGSLLETSRPIFYFNEEDLWTIGLDNNIIPFYTHHIEESEYEFVMGKALINAKKRGR